MPRRVLEVIDALPRRRRRRAGRRRLALEAIVVLALTAAAAVGVYVWKVHPARSDWVLAGASVQNVSRAPGAQTQVAVAADPSHPGVLFAASNDTALRTVRVYTSNDDGGTWTSRAGPALGADACERGDPAAAVDAEGRQVVAFTVSGACSQDDQTPYVVAAVRSSSTAAWTVRRLGGRRQPDFWDDHPSVAAAPDGRLYVVWSRLLRWTYEGIVVSSSSDGGRTWTSPRVVDMRLVFPRLATTTVAPDGSLYVAGVDARFGVWLARSRDAGRSFTLARVARLPGNRTADCATASGHPTPFQGIRCVGPNPTVSATARRIFLTYGVGWPGERQSVHIGVLDPDLHPIWRGSVGPPNLGADRFWPTSTVDPGTGRVWACFYDTSGDHSGKHAWFSCTHSSDGRAWSRPVRAARDASSPEVLWEDARVYVYGDIIGFGGYTGVAAARGSAHPLWIDTADLGGKKQEVFGAILR